MAIKKDVSFKFDSNLLTGEVIYETLSDTRLVDPYKTAIHVIRIEEWLNDNNMGYEFGNQNLLIPENNTNPDNKYSLDSVRYSHKLLSLNKLIPFNAALFLLLGLDVSALMLPPFNQLKLFNYYQPEMDSSRPFEHVFFITDEFDELVYSRFVREDGKILSDDLIKLAKDNDNKFFQDKGLRHILKQKKKISNTEVIDRNKKINNLWNELYPELNKSYPSKVSIYREIIQIQKLEIKEDAVKKIIANKAKWICNSGIYIFPNVKIPNVSRTPKRHSLAFGNSPHLSLIPILPR